MKIDAVNRPPATGHRSPFLTRSQMLRALPKHAGIAVLSGAATGFILYWLKEASLPGQWNLLLFFPIAAIYANGITLPVIIPGRYWSFGFIGATMMLLLLLASTILTPKFSFPHSYIGGAGADSAQKVNLATYAALSTGGCLGLFYGLLCGGKPAMISGLVLGAGAGFLLGGVSAKFVTAGPPQTSFDQWVYDSPLHFAWQVAACFGCLHIASGFGAALGAQAKRG